MANLSIRTAVVHLKAVERDDRRNEEHFSAVLRVGDTLRIVGEESYERDVAREWESRWSGATLLVSAKPIVLSAPVEVLQIEALECQPAKLDLDRRSESGVIKRTITVRPRPGNEAASVTAEIRGLPGTVKAVRRLEETGAWAIDLEFGPWPDSSALTVGAVVVFGSPVSETSTVELPVYVR